MPNFLHRTDKTYLRSYSGNKLPEPISNYIEDPDLSAVEGQPVRYWEISGDTVTLADQATRDAIDAQLLSDQRDAVAAQLEQQEDIMRAFALVVLDEINTLRQQFNTTTAETNQLTTTTLADRTVQQLKTALRNKLGT